jgi:hypothetical protein
LAKTYNDLMIPDAEYHSKKRLLELGLESLVIPEVNATQEAGKLIISLPQLWASANPSEKRRLILSVLDAVFCGCKANQIHYCHQTQATLHPDIPSGGFEERCGYPYYQKRVLRF